MGWFLIIFTLRTYLTSTMSFISKIEDNRYLVVLIISKLFLTRSISSTYRVKNIIPLIVIYIHTIIF